MDGPTSTRRGNIDLVDFAHTETSGAAASTEEKALGRPGRPLSRRSPFFIGFMGATGVLAAYVLVRMVADLTTILQLIGLSLFLAIGLDPASFVDRAPAPAFGRPRLGLRSPHLSADGSDRGGRISRSIRSRIHLFQVNMPIPLPAPP